MNYMAVPPPGFTQEQQRRIIEVLGQKLRHCSGCGKLQTLQLVTDGIIYMPVTQPLTYPDTYIRSYPDSSAGSYALPAFAPPTFQGRNLPCIALLCSNCGHLQFHSVLQLGLGAVLGVLPPTAPLYGGL
jgi:hypothetical protein